MPADAPTLAAFLLTGVMACWAGQARAVDYGSVRVGVDERGEDVEEKLSTGEIDREAGAEGDEDRSAAQSSPGSPKAGAGVQPRPATGQ
jgi:hypothetical protein